MIVYAWNPWIWNVDTGGSQVQSQLYYTVSSKPAWTIRSPHLTMIKFTEVKRLNPTVRNKLLSSHFTLRHEVIHSHTFFSFPKP